MNYLHPQMGEPERHQLSILALAHIGDGVFELMIRSYLALHGLESSHHLHVEAVKRVKASSQAKDVDVLLPYLTEAEIAVYKRGRNATPKTVPVSCTRAEYSKATGLEALWGDLFLQGNTERLEELFQIIVSENAVVDTGHSEKLKS